MSEQTAARSNMIEFNLLDVVDRVIRGKWIIFSVAVLGLVLGVGVASIIKPWYSALALFLPPRDTDLSSGTASSLLSGSGGGDSSELYLGLLASRTVQDDVIDHLGLMQIYHAPNRTVARAILSHNSTFGVSSTTLVAVAVTGATPKLAADIANAYLDALYRVNGDMVATSSDHRRVFFQQQLEEQKTQLTLAENAMKQTEERTHLVLPGSEAAANVASTAGIQSQINEAEQRLSGLMVSETEQNPQVVQARAQLAQLRGQLERQLADTNNGSQAGLPSTTRLPGLTLEFQQKDRELKQAEASYDAMLQQYTKARLAATDPGPQLEIVDRAIPAEFKSGPSRKQYGLYGMALGALLPLLYLLFIEPLRLGYAFLKHRNQVASR